MEGEPDHLQVLAFYGEQCRPHQVEPLGSAGGFSGARFWRLTTDSGRLCLRRWPKEFPSAEQLEFIQAVLWYVAREGFNLVPLPLENRRFAGYVRHAGYLWELAPWMPGRADYRRHPSPQKLRAAMVALAEFHLAAASFPLPAESPGQSPGICERSTRLRDWMSGGLERLAGAMDPGVWPELAERGSRILALFPVAAKGIGKLLAASAGHEVALQPCIRDIWEDHVLYVGPRVSGLVDFGSMRPENVAGDVARLLGSMAGDDPSLWQAGLEAYGTRRPLCETEMDLVRSFDRSTTLMAGLNWLDWVFQQRRHFEHPTVVLDRVDAILLRLEVLALQ
jgi:Ser/Thr protein kinase RdoA (MazF antagonist)